MLRTIFTAALFTFVATGCGGSSGEESYDTYQACFEDHHNSESLSVHDSIVVCCLEHPIAGVHPSCKDTAAECVTYLGTNLSGTSATSTEVMTACADYITEKNR